MTQNYDEFAGVREELLLHIMNFVEESGTTLASPSQTLYLSGDSPLQTKKNEIAAKAAGDAKASG
jgi:MscS family membrane protein